MEFDLYWLLVATPVVFLLGWMASQVDLRARGCGENTTPLRVLRQISALKIAVEVGLVVGTMPQMMPIGSAMVMVPKLSSSDNTPQVFSSLYLL